MESVTFIEIDMNDCVNRIIHSVIPSQLESVIFLKIDTNDYVNKILQKLYDLLMTLDVKYCEFLLNRSDMRRKFLMCGQRQQRRLAAIQRRAVELVWYQFKASRTFFIPRFSFLFFSFLISLDSFYVLFVDIIYHF